MGTPQRDNSPTQAAHHEGEQSKNDVIYLFVAWYILYHRLAMIMGANKSTNTPKTHIIFMALRKTLYMALTCCTLSQLSNLYTTLTAYLAINESILYSKHKQYHSVHFSFLVSIMALTLIALSSGHIILFLNENGTCKWLYYKVVYSCRVYGCINIHVYSKTIKYQLFFSHKH